MLNKIKQIDNITLKFVIVGGIGFVVNYATLHTLSNQFGIHKIVAEIIAVVIALQITFILHDRWTYKKPQDIGDNALKIHLKTRYVLYLASNFFSSSSTVIIFSILIQFIQADFIVLVIAATIQMVWNYIMNRFVIWKRKIEKNNTSQA